jgi:coenzyme PQQ biosynthesis protein PqqD
VTPIDANARPRLARGVRLRLDHISGKTLLLRPEQGFELQGSALEIVKLCTAELTVDGIVDRLAEAHADMPRADIADDVHRLLGDLGRRGAIDWEPR